MNIVSALKERLHEALPLWGAVVLALLTARLIETAYVHAHHALPVPLWPHALTGALHDIRAALFVSLGLTVLYVLIASANRGAAFWGFTAGAALVAVLQGMLARYYATTLQPLGRNFWAYEPGEVLETLSASRAAGLSFGAAILALIGVTVGSALLLRGRRAPNTVLWGAGGLLGLGLVAAPPSLNDTQPAAQHLAPNKTVHFVAESAGLLTGRDARGTVRVGAAADSAQVGGTTRPYPWMYRAQYDDVLGPFFDAPTAASPPNVVFIVFEGLGTAFVGDEAPYGGFTPFVDSLAQESLYWPNMLTTTGRTFGLMPSLFGSLPYAERGFMAMGDEMPRHQSLIRLLGDEGYHTSYYSGFDTRFDNVDRFLRRQGLDRTIDRGVLHRLFGDDTGTEQRYWGYPDREMFARASTIIDTTAQTPRLEIFHTLQTHDPFSVPDKAAYGRRFERRLRALNPDAGTAQRYRKYQSELTTFLYTDDALRQFFASYRTRLEFQNTIFVITGDHRLIPIPQPSQIARYHVPLLIYSPLLHQADTFRSVSTLADVPPTLLGLLQNHYGLSFPERAHWLGTRLDTARAFRNVHSMPLMRNKNQLIDYLHKEHYLAGDQLYRLGPGMSLAPVSAPDTKATMVRRLARFRRINRHVTQNDRLYDPDRPLSGLPPTTPFRAASTPPSSPGGPPQGNVAAVLESARGLPPAEQFQRARKEAFDGEYEAARALARRLLEQHPDYHDVRLLLGRTYAWTHQFDRARTAFRAVLRRDSTVADAYNALADAETWAGAPDAALSTVNAGLRHHPERPSFLEKKARALIALGRTAEARSVLSTLRRVAPSSDKLSSLQAQLNS